MPNRLVYTLLFYLLLPLVLLRLLYRAWKAPAYVQRWRERFGWFDARAVQGVQTIWVHSVSVGESIAAAPLVRQLQQAYPDHRLVVTTMTPTGSERVVALYGDSVFHVYAPYDLPDAVARFLARVEPRLAIIMETELWPNTVAACAARNIPVVLANARLSERSARGYGKFSALVKPMLNQLAMIAAQDDATASRFLGLGIDPDRVTVTGSIKFDLEVDDVIRDSGKSLRQQWLANKQAGVRVLVAASTHPGEDEQILDAWQGLAEDLLLIIVPRHPERFGKVAELLKQRGICFARRSSNETVTESVQVVLGDTMGELMVFFAAADLAFIGGSLVPTGGHNMLEASAMGVPVFSGPHFFNFKDIADQLCAAGAMIVVDDSADLSRNLKRQLADDEQRRVMGAAGVAVVDENRGALQKQLGICRRLLD